MFGKLLNGVLEKAFDAWIKSDAARRYLASGVLRIGTLAMGTLLLRWGAKYGLDDTTKGQILGHWSAILELAAPAIGLALIEAVAVFRARLNATTVQIAVEAGAGTLTPDSAKEAAKTVLANPDHTPTPARPHVA